MSTGDLITEEAETPVKDLNGNTTGLWLKLVLMTNSTTHWFISRGGGWYSVYKTGITFFLTFDIHYDPREPLRVTFQPQDK